MRFGHHQSFYLRVNWISKAIKMLLEDEQGARFFYDEFGFERIGLGKNMVKSLKFWALATAVIEEGKNDEQKTIHRLTPFGDLLNRYDRFLRLPFTTAIMHYFLASNIEQATTWYWFFNEYSHRSGTNAEVLEQLVSWVEQRQSKSVSINSLKKDLDCLKQLYTIRSRHSDDPEEVVVSPFSRLMLLQDSKELLIKRNPELEQVGMEALYYTLLAYCNKHQVSGVTLEELQYKHLLWGKIFNLTSNQILEALEYFQTNTHYPVSFVRTNQIYNLTIEVEDANAFLEKAYRRKAAF